ncbi:MAG TPA: tetratricopeptide repeat protein [Gemmatimonadales bacterium]|nr:tetratricopeptide repeat protein [Gemmatimonadales bacterium]
MNFEKLKETARKFEQKEEWRRAIDVYQQAIREFEAGHDPAPDLAIYNRVGDLYLKANEPGAAVQAYEKAADLYKDQGFYNNAIALCGKILRVNPGRIQTYLTLAHLHARKNVVIEAKKNLLEYLERMNALGQLDQAFKAVKDFADQFPSNKEIRLMLSELLRASDRFEEAREQLEKLASDLEARGDTQGARKTLARLQALDAEESDTTPKAPSRPKPGELVFLDTGGDAGGSHRRSSVSRKSPARGVEPTRIVERTPSLPKMDMPDEAAAEEQQVGIETSSLTDVPLTLESVQPISDEAQMEMTHLDVAQTLGFEPTIAEEPSGDQVRPLDGLEIDAPRPDTVDIELAPDLGIERNLDAEEDVENITSSELELIAPEGLEETPDLSDDLALDLQELPVTEESAEDEGLGLDLIDPDAPLTSVPIEDLPLADLGAEEPVEGEDTGSEVDFLEVPEARQLTVDELEDQVLEDPDNPDTHRALGEALLAAGESPRGQEELELALSAYENREDWDHASDLVSELIRLDPSGVRYHQKRVELAFRGGDRTRLLDAYVELGDALMRVGALDKAVAVYRRVVDHDPDNARAQAALDSLAPPEEAPPALAGLEVEDAEGEIDIREATEDELAEADEPEERRGPRWSAPMFAPSSDFVDLGSLVLDDEAPRDLRMRVEDEEPTGDEQKDFQEMLTQFKRGVDENIGAEDFQAHYDLGVAFREMGLLDESIAEFQKALRAPEGRLRTSEALGTAFFDKKQFAIAEAILRRAVESLGASDEEQIGLLYWLGRAREEQGKIDTALPCYERVLAVDIGFHDAGSRMARLAGSR